MLYVKKKNRDYILRKFQIFKVDLSTRTKMTNCHVKTCLFSKNGCNDNMKTMSICIICNVGITDDITLQPRNHFIFDRMS